MKRLFRFSKLSAQITFIIGVMVLIVAGGVAGYMQTRIVTEIGRHSALGLQYLAVETADECNAILFDAALGNSADGASAAAIENLVKGVKTYDTGFLLLRDGGGKFFDTNEFIRQLGSGEQQRLADAAHASMGEVFEIKLGGDAYLSASAALFNGCEVFVLAPKTEVNHEVTASLKRFIIIFIVAYSLVLVAAYIIGRNTGKPIAALSAFMRRVGSTGDITYLPGEEQTLAEYNAKGDEVGLLIGDSCVFINQIIHVSEELETLAGGDLTVEVNSLSDKDVMANSLNKMIFNLSHMFSEVHNSASQVSTGSRQIADGASSLAQGATEQAAAIDRLSSSIHNIYDQTGRNAAVAREAADMSNGIRVSAERGSAQMDSMMQAVKDIDDASEQIGKVIKVIDDIAFQTNILALNASVEAARAGQHGKGFAVVAEEVRSLAAKSAEAAKDTGGLIENTVAKAHLGMSIAAETAQSLKEIVEGINRSAGVIGKIAEDSDSQSAAIDRLNAGISQVSQVIQQNSAAAEQSAASAEQMNGQSVTLEDLISQFKLKSANTGLRGLPPSKR